MKLHKPKGFVGCRRTGRSAFTIPHVLPVEEGVGDVAEARICWIMHRQDFAVSVAAGLRAARRPANHLAV